MSPLVSLTDQLIRFRSTHDRPEERTACLAFMEQLFHHSNLCVETHSRNGVENLFISKANKTPKVLLYAHYDVVEGEDHQFVPQEKDGKLYGRGAFDMKSGLACFLTLMKELAHTSHDVGLMIVGDEEISGKNGAAYLTEIGYGGDVILMPDGGMQISNLIIKEKGILRFRLEAEGIAAHSSRPWLGKSAIDLLHQAIEQIKNLFPTLNEHPDNHWVPTFIVGTIQGGIVFNQVPAHAFALCDIRVTEDCDPTKLLEQIKHILPPGTSLSLEAIGTAQTTDPNHPLFASFIDVLKEKNIDPKLDITHGSSDMGHFSAQGSPVIMCQPEGDNPHGLDEWVSIDAMKEYYTVVKEYVDRVGK